MSWNPEYRQEISRIINNHLSLDVKEYCALIDELAEYMTEEVFQKICDARGD